MKKQPVVFMLVLIAASFIGFFQDPQSPAAKGTTVECKPERQCVNWEQIIAEDLKRMEKTRLAYSTIPTK